MMLHLSDVKPYVVYVPPPGGGVCPAAVRPKAITLRVRRAASVAVVPRHGGDEVHEDVDDVGVERDRRHDVLGGAHLSGRG